MKTQTKIWITTSFIGFHRWAEAQDSLKYLSYRHRHKFGVRVEVTPTSSKDRSTEFHSLKETVDKITSHISELSQTEDFRWSCEMMAEYIISFLNSTNIYKSISVSIDEDGECGATLYLEEK